MNVKTRSGNLVRGDAAVAQPNHRPATATLDGAVELRILGAGHNWMTVASLLAAGLGGYESPLPEGSTVAAISGDPGYMCMEAPRLVAEGHYHMAITTPWWYARMAIEGRGPF